MKKSNMEIEEDYSIIQHPKSFQGKQEEDVSREKLLDQIEWLIQHPTIFRLISHNLITIKEGCKPQIAELKAKEKNNTNCPITPMNRKIPGVIIIETDDPGYEDILYTMENYPKYREKLVRSHLAHMRALNIKIKEV